MTQHRKKCGHHTCPVGECTLLERTQAGMWVNLKYATVHIRASKHIQRKGDLTGAMWQAMLAVEQVSSALSTYDAPETKRLRKAQK